MRTLLTFLITCTSLFCLAQDPDLSSRIYSYEDSTRVLIKNSRQLILESIKSGDYAEADRIKDYAENNVDHTQYALFSLGEDFLISYYTNDYSRIVLTISNWDSLKSAPSTIFIPENDKLYVNLMKQAIQDSSSVYESLFQMVTSGEQHDMLKIVFKSLLSADPASAITQEQLNRDVDRYLSNYQVSPYHKFLKENVRLVFEDKWGYSVFMGAGFGGLNGGLSQYIESFTPVLLGMEFYFRRKAFLGFRLQGGGGETVQNFTFEGDWPVDMRVNPLYIGLTGGYTLVDTKNIRLAGMLELGGISITPVEDERTPETKDLKLNSFAWGPSMFLDYYPFAKDGFIGQTRFGLRVQGGILLLNYENKDQRFDGNYPYVGISLVLDLFEKSRVRD